MNDKGALVNEITEKHDEISHWKDKLRKAEEKFKNSKAQVAFREDIIKELRNVIRQKEKVEMHD